MAEKSLKEKAYSIIRQKIIECEYLPGQLIVESEIVELVGASRTPIREALNKLEQERLVKIMPKRGVFVSDISVAAVHEVYDVRELVEPHFVQKYAHLIPQPQVNEMLERLGRLSQQAGGITPEYYVFDNDLHHLFISGNQNSYLRIMLKQVYAQNNRIRVLSGRFSMQRMHETQNEHYYILQAMQMQNYSKAAAEMLAHLKAARNAALQAITSNSSMFIGAGN